MEPPSMSPRLCLHVAVVGGGSDREHCDRILGQWLTEGLNGEQGRRVQVPKI